MKYRLNLLIVGIFPCLLQAQTLYISSGATVYTNNTSNTTTLHVAGTIENRGSLKVAGGVNGTQDLTFNGTLNVPIGGITLGTNYDQITTTGAATITSSTLTVTLENGYTPVNGASFTIIDAGTLSGTFTTTNLPTLTSGLSWLISYNNAVGTVILSVSSALPVELLSFKATPSVSSVFLDWQTAVEENTKNFILERSRDGKDFMQIATITAKGSNSSYTHEDEKPYKGINYYRLKINDIDGKIAYSKIVSAQIGNKTFKVKAYPSLVSDMLNISTDGGEIEDFQIINLAGQTVFSKTKAIQSSGGLVSINLSNLEQGIYLVRAKNTEGVVSTTKIVKP